MRSVYVEITVVSYLTATPSRDLVVAAHQQVTLEWWEKARQRYDLYASVVVIDEVSEGDREAAEKRLGIVENMKHIVNGDVILAVQEMNAARGMLTPLICTPEELVEAPW